MSCKARYTKVNKIKARKLFYCGHTIYLLPCKVSFVALYTGGNKWVKPVEISIFNNKQDFDNIVNYYEYYNCNSDLGRYPHFYVNDEVLESQKMCDLMCGR